MCSMERINFEKILFHPETLSQYMQTGIFHPYHMSIGLISSCNHACQWCYVDFAKQNILIEPDLLLTALSDAQKSWGLKAITIVGMGEPTLHPQFVSIIKSIRMMEIEIGLFTNGSRLSGDTAKALLDATFVRISLDAATPETHGRCHGTDDFARIIDNIRDFVQQKRPSSLPTVGIQFAACQLNKKDIIPMADLAISLGVDYLSYKPVYKNRHNPDHPANEMAFEEAAALLGEAKKRENKHLKIYTKLNQFHDVLEDGFRTYTKCRAHSVSPYIEEDGSIAFCGNLYPDSIIGNLHAQSLTDIWYGDRHRRLIKNIDMKNCVQGCKYHRLNMIFDELFHYDSQLHMNF